MIDTKPTDDQIIAAVSKFGETSPTYVIANRLRIKGRNVRTDWVLRQMKRMEKAGRVERVPSSYAVMIVWRATRPAT